MVSFFLLVANGQVLKKKIHVYFLICTATTLRDGKNDEGGTLHSLCQQASERTKVSISGSLSVSASAISALNGERCEGVSSNLAASAASDFRMKQN